MAYEIQLRHDTAANWTSADPTLAQGEAGYETDTGKLKIGDGATAWSSLAYFGGSGGVTSLDSITGAVSLVAGSNVTISDNDPSSGDITIASSGGGGVTQLDYVETTTDLTVTATTPATAQTFIAGNAVTYDGSTRIKIEAWLAFGGDPAASENWLLSLYDGAASIIDDFYQQDIKGSGAGAGVYAVRFLTPSAGSHTYSIAVWKGTGSVVLHAASPYAPAWYRITEA